MNMYAIMLVKNEADKEVFSFRHVKEADWQELFKSRNELVFDDGKIEMYRALPVRNNIKQGRLKKMLIRILITLRIYDMHIPTSTCIGGGACHNHHHCLLLVA